MAIEFGLGRFGDRRLEKGGSPCTLPWLSGPAVAFGGLRAGGHKRCDSRASCAITR
jgi:hypothetical protein